jgi:Tfp pilus assembly protein FimT
MFTQTQNFPLRQDYGGQVKLKSILGFTMIELLVVMTLVIFVASLTLYFSLDMYRGYAFRNERNLVVSILQKARMEALSNVGYSTLTNNGSSHGVRFEADEFVVFEGPTYTASCSPSSTNLCISANTGVTHSGANEITFNQLDGTSSGGSVTLSNGTHTSVITVNSEGQISWTN